MTVRVCYYFVLFFSALHSSSLCTYYVHYGESIFVHYLQSPGSILNCDGVAEVH